MTRQAHRPLTASSTALAEWMEGTKLTVTALAKKWKISQMYLSNLRTGRYTPSLKLAVRIEKLTGGAVPASSWAVK